jgi:hypothetical protein
MVSPSCHDFFGCSLSRFGSSSKEFGDFHFQCLCEKVSVFVRGYILLQLDIAEHIARDAEKVQNLNLRNQHVLGQLLLIAQPGNIPANEIRITPHNLLRHL